MDPMTIAERLVNDLMLVHVVVAGPGAAALAASLEAAGSAAEELSDGAGAGGYDMAILLAETSHVAEPATRALVERLSGASERLLLAPVPLGTRSAGEAVLPELDQWFELFAEFGYQPVVEFDAGFVSAGAFLVDRAAIAAEGDMAAFAERVQHGGVAEAARPPAEVPARAEETAALLRRLEAAEAALAAAGAALADRQSEVAGLAARMSELQARQAAAEGVLAQARADSAGWDGLRHWVRAAAAEPSCDSPEALARALPRLNALRGDAPPVVLPPPPKRRFWQRGVAAPAIPLLAETALVRASHLFDAAWYIASTADLAEGAALDPVFHYVLVGAAQGADPGPWFDSAAYLIAHPELVGTGVVPLVHAIRTGASQDMGG